jgi:acetolactate synthase-1/2/3 large subunit
MTDVGAETASGITQPQGRSRAERPAPGPTYADAVVDALLDVGVQRLFGMPGGGSSSDLIRAAARARLPFSLAQTESAAAFMATAQAELTGAPGACLATLGPGAASMANGVANAHLDRVPLVVITDCRTAELAAVMEHQTLPHGAMFSPVVKWTGRPEANGGLGAIREAMEAVTSLPPGPVHLDLAAEFTSATVVADDHVRRPTRNAGRLAEPLPPEVEGLLCGARRPVLLVGLGARDPEVASQLRKLAARIGVPALVTYKAKGVIPDRHPWFAGVLTNGALEREVLQGADIFVAVGFDPVELLPRPWDYAQPIVAINPWPLHQRQLPIRHEIVGDVRHALDAVEAALSTRTTWDSTEIRRLAESQRSRMRPSIETDRLLPHRVVDLVADVYAGARVTVDAGAHMFPVMSLWPASEPLDVLISNGLATMGFAVPAAIGAALLDRDRRTVAFTGDGGLLMCVAELLTATRERVPIRVVVFDDAALSLIKVKQEQRGYEPQGVDMGRTDWQRVGAGFGVTVREATDERALTDALEETADDPGPVLIAARVAADTYGATMRVLRG